MSLSIIARSVWGNRGNRGKLLRKSLDAARWQLRKRLWPTPRLIRLANGTVFNAHPDCIISSALAYADWPEFEELMFIRRNLQAGSIVIDIGANVGHISLLLADLVGPENLYAFEPTPESFRRLQDNWKANSWPSNQLFPIALGDREGTVYVPNPASPLTTVSVSTTSNGTMAKTQMKKLDSFIELFKPRSIGFLKIDVEGDEEAVFRGGQHLFRDCRPRLVMFEALNESAARDSGSILRSMQYRVFQLDPHGDPDFSGLSAQNLFAAPEEGPILVGHSCT